MKKDVMTRMYNPPHPGEILTDTVLRKDGGVTVTKLAKRLNVSRVALSRVVNGRAAVSAELAIRLAAALGGSAESWLNMQVSYDLGTHRKSAGRGSSDCAKRIRRPNPSRALVVRIWTGLLRAAACE